MTVVRSVIRSIKNEINNYDEGERLVRELTSNESTPPSTQMLIKLKHMLSNQYQFPSIFNMLMKRLKDYDKIRHVEKTLIVIEYLLKNGDKKFIRYCQMEVKTITRLQRYRYILNFKDYGGLIRKRAKRIFDLLKDEKKLHHARAKAQGYSMAYKKGNQYQHQKQQNTKVKKKSKDHKSRNAKKSSSKSKKKRSKKTNKNTNEPKFESFIDVPADKEFKNDEFFEAPVNEDLLSDDWWSTSNQSKDSTVDEDFGWYTAGGDGPEAGFGDDGGQFNFGDETEFDADENVDGDGDDEEENLEKLYSELTQIDNILEVKKKTVIQVRNKQGKTMAQMVNDNSVVHSGVQMPSSFDVSFINEALNPASNSNGSDFDPFGLDSKSNGNAGGFDGPKAAVNPSSLFGYRAKTQSNMYPYGNDPFAGLASVNGQKYHTMGLQNTANISRMPPKSDDPFSEFTIK